MTTNKRIGLRHVATKIDCTIGETLTDFRGEKAILSGWPDTGRNRVWVEIEGQEQEFFPSVYDLELYDKTA